MVSTRQMTITTGPGNSSSSSSSGSSSNNNNVNNTGIGSNSIPEHEQLQNQNFNVVAALNGAHLAAASPRNNHNLIYNQKQVVIVNYGAANFSGGNTNSTNTTNNSTGLALISRYNNIINESNTEGASNGSAPNNDTNNEPENLQPVQNLYLLDMPIELLEKILTYVGYKKVAQLRGISHKMNTICSSILNSTFQKLQTQMYNRFQSVKAKMPRRESARRNHPLACECDIIETCYMRLSLLQMTFGKHIERKHCCFFPGGILDEVYNVIHYIRITPKLGRPYKVTDELFDLSTMAMEYFKEHIEANLPEIAYFSKDFLDFTSNNKQNYLIETKSSLSSIRDSTSHTSSLPSPPQSNMVLRKGIRKIKQGMKRYSNELCVLRSELRTCKRKATEQSKQILEQQKLLAEQQKQTIEYANRLDEYDKKNEEMSRKFSTLLQELNKCKTELQYWRSKSPATPVCNSCGQAIAVPLEEIQVLMNQGVKPEDMGLSTINNDSEFDEEDEDSLTNVNEKSGAIDGFELIKHNAGINSFVEITENNNIGIDTATSCDTVSVSDTTMSNKPQSEEIHHQQIDLIDNCSATITTSVICSTKTIAPVAILSSKRKLNDNCNISTANGIDISNELNNDILPPQNKKIKRVQNKVRCQNGYSSNNIKTRNK